MVYKLHMLTWIEVKKLLDKGVSTVILPVGTIEPHGTHLTMGTDALIPESLGEILAERLDALLLPTIYYGVTKSLYGYPGSVRVEPETLEKMIFEVLSSMVFHGFKSAIILNGHGGSEQVIAVDRAVYRLWVEYKMPSIIIEWWTLAREKGLTKDVLGKEGGHAGSDETACILAKYPSLVKRDLYCEKEIEVYSKGVKTYPYRGSIIHYSMDEDGIVFDKHRAEEYFGKLVDLIEKEVRRFLESLKRFDEL